MQLLYVLIALVVIGVGGWFGGQMYGGKDCKAEVKVSEAKAETAKAKDDAKGAKRSGKREAERARDQAHNDPIVNEVKADVEANPSPRECVTPPQRLRNLNRLIDAANATGGVRGPGSEAQATGDGQPGGGGAVDHGRGAQVPGAAKELRMPQGLEH